MLVPEAPLDAYRSDLARDKTREDFGGADTVWLLSAHCISRICRATPQDLPTLGAQCAAALREFAQPATDGTDIPKVEIADLLLVVDGFSNLRSRDGADALARGVRGMATRMAYAGALSMAYTLVTMTRKVAGEACDREHGLLAADQGMIARLLGDLDAAEEIYSAAERLGEKAKDLTVLARAFIGRGVVDRVRGNYPRSRVFFERGLELGETIEDRELMRLAHQGLTICHAISKNFDRALQHGWSTLKLSDGDSGRESEALGNLAQLCLDSGYPAAALRAYAAVLSRAVSGRIALSALGGAAMAAAQAGDHNVLARVRHEVTTRTSTSGLPYENAQALYQLAMAYATVGNVPEHEDFLVRARKLAKARGFFELVHKTEPSVVAKALPPVAASVTLTNPSREVVAHLAEFEVGDAAGMLALTRSS